MSVTAITLAALKSFFLFLPTVQEKDAGPYEAWLRNDGFRPGTLKDPSKTSLLKELDDLKSKFVKSLHQEFGSLGAEMKRMTPLNVVEVISKGQIQIDRLRLLIEHETFFVKNHQKSTGTTYYVARAYWIDDLGKKDRKFAKNLGPEDKVLEGGKIPTWRKDQVEREINEMMLAKYREEYG